jgi:putative endonuclease
MWYLYLIRCGDETLYTGITTDVERRFGEHQSGGRRAAKYLRGRGPLELVAQVGVGERAQAARLELRVKALSRDEKERLVRDPARLVEMVELL